MINSEDDVRAWVRLASGGKARWIEPALGSTPGLPDCWVPFQKEVLREGEFAVGGTIVQVHLELKIGRITRNILTYNVRPEQRKQIIAMQDDGVRVGFLVGIKGTKSLLFILPGPEARHGQFSLLAPSLANNRFHTTDEKLCDFWDGVNFIFSGEVI